MGFSKAEYFELWDMNETLVQWFSNFHEPWPHAPLISLTGEYLIYRGTWVVQYYLENVSVRGPQRSVP